ncbi:YjgN family protein [Robiginitomaculum antarcticum]|uniref:hypothetical protein n=1 Tax=Robiginitomaculum antarcticum TaxID=437507 RepID=UPI0003602F97|nr:hypothetical protein [Robiginitomaculum antarcticum]
MMNLFFSPNGRISSPDMIKGGLILILIGLIPSFLNYLFGPGMVFQILGWLTLLLIVPWIFLWMKRYRDGGQSPAMCLVPILVYVVLYLILAAVLMGGEVMSMFGAAMEVGADDPEAMEAAMEGAMDVKAIALKGMIAGLLASLITLFGLNALIKHKPSAKTDTLA